MWYRRVGDLGAKRVIPEVVCYPPILTTKVCNGGSGGHTRLPGSRQDTIVRIHTLMDMEQQSDNKLITPAGMG